MIQVTITRDGQITNQATFPTQEEAQAWLSSHEGMKTFGTPAHIVQQQVEIFPAVIDEDGIEISPAQFEIQDFQIPATYQVEIMDISAQMAQEAINAAALKMLAESDWMILRHFRETALGQQTTLSSEGFLELEQLRSDAAARIIK